MKNYFYAPIIIIIVMLSGCTGLLNSEEDAINNFCKNFTDGQIEYVDFLEYATIDPKYLGTNIDFLKEVLEPYFNEKSKETTYEILSVTPTDDGATVSVKFTFVDSSNVFLVTSDKFVEKISDKIQKGVVVQTSEFKEIFLNSYMEESGNFKEEYDTLVVDFNLKKNIRGYYIDDFDDEFFNVLLLNVPEAFKKYTQKQTRIFDKFLS